MHTFVYIIYIYIYIYIYANIIYIYFFFNTVHMHSIHICVLLRWRLEAYSVQHGLRSSARERSRTGGLRSTSRTSNLMVSTFNINRSKKWKRKIFVGISGLIEVNMENYGRKDQQKVVIWKRVHHFCSKAMSKRQASAFRTLLQIRKPGEAKASCVHAGQRWYQMYINKPKQSHIQKKLAMFSAAADLKNVLFHVATFEETKKTRQTELDGNFDHKTYWSAMTVARWFVRLDKRVFSAWCRWPTWACECKNGRSQHRFPRTGCWGCILVESCRCST